jgi:Domain of unknown function (DUF4331)
MQAIYFGGLKTRLSMEGEETMLFSSKKKIAFFACALTMAIGTLLTPPPRIDAADHRDGPIITDIGSLPFDISNVYFFLDPNDNSKVIMGLNVSGFIIPGENSNSGAFASNVRYRLEIETSGDARPDHFFDITFSPRQDVSAPQTATIILPSGGRFTAGATPSSSTDTTAPAPVITTDPITGVSFFAGLTDDPFFFDIPAELRYRASLISGSPDPSFFNRGCDSIAGYNNLMIALRVPASLLRGQAVASIGLSATVQRRNMTFRSPDGDLDFGMFVNVDRMGVPSINTLFLPFARKDDYNRASTIDDANGKFVDDIVNTLRRLRTDDASIEIIKRLAVTNGDMLRLNPLIPNTGPGGGNNAAAAFPNGRRPGDDVIDAILTIVNNRVALGDNVNANDAPFRNTFPFFAPPTQPFPAGTIDDRTRN